MISMVVATRNRAYTLRRVLPSFFSQDEVDEIVLVNDAGTDETEEVFTAVAVDYPGVRAVHIRNPKQLGAPGARNRGAATVTNEYILFCDDDLYLEDGYAATCLEILRSRPAGVVSGRCIYLQPGERPEDGLARFGSGRLATRPYRPHLCFIVNEAHFTGEVSQPLVSSIMLTTTEIVRLFPFDEYYAHAPGYREESDFQMRVFLSGRDVVVSDRVHSFHLPMSEVATGGNRTTGMNRIKGMVVFNGYFYDKLYDAYAERIGIRTPRWAAKYLFAGFAFYRVAVVPRGYQLAHDTRQWTRRLRTSRA